MTLKLVHILASDGAAASHTLVSVLYVLYVLYVCDSRPAAGYSVFVVMHLLTTNAQVISLIHEVILIRNGSTAGWRSPAAWIHS